MKKSSVLIAALGFLLGSVNGWSYGPRSVTATGNLVKWALPVRIDLENTLQVRGKDVSALVDEGLGAWSGVKDAGVSYSKQSLGVDVTADNVCCYLYDSAICPKGPITDGKNPLVIDEDGSIVAKFFGKDNRYVTLGFAAIVSFDAQTGAAAKGEAVFNAACLNTVELEGCKDAKLSFSDDDFVAFIVHEIGHMLGLNHSQVNLTEAQDSDASNDAQITTMYPFFKVGIGKYFKTPERDDQVGIAFLYPSADFSQKYFMVTGTIYDKNGKTEFACANLVARNSSAGKERTDAVSFVSGQLCPGGKFDGSCDGNYEIHGLDPSQAYTISVEPIDSHLVSSSGMPPCESTGRQPTFDKQTRVGTVNNTTGGTSSGIDFTLTNTSGNVNRLLLGELDISSSAGFDGSVVADEIEQIELKSATDSCSSDTTSGGTNSTADGGSTAASCTLIPERN